MNTTHRTLKPHDVDINARLDFEAEHDARALQDTELLRRDLNATFNDADRGMPMTMMHRSEREASIAPARACAECRQAIHPGILRKVPDAQLCYDCYAKRRKPTRP